MTRYTFKRGRFTTLNIDNPEYYFQPVKSNSFPKKSNNRFN
jgi:hypothetical protein